MILLPLLAAASLSFAPQTARDAFEGREGALVILDTQGDALLHFNETACQEKLAPCSTFKIWNTAIGLETGIISDPDAPFWKWDGQQYRIDAWNRDQTLRSAFQVSCVPAYQALARQIGAERMKEYLDKLAYGDRDISAGLDVFWLPEKGRRTLRISPDEQAALIGKLLNGNVPFSKKTLSVLKDIMKVKETDRGTLYGKTGTGRDASGTSNIGWFVGYVESGERQFPFACVLKAKAITGADARDVAAGVFSKAGLL